MSGVGGLNARPGDFGVVSQVPVVIDRDRGSRVRGSFGWGLATLSLLVGLGVVAPSGLALLLFLGIVIVAHEGGHWWVARRAGMQPTEFYWGFGPEAVSVAYNGCRYGVKVLPFGGYVKLEGMTPTSKLSIGFPEAGTYRAASHRGRLATILAGPAVNLAMAFVGFSIAWAAQGVGWGQALVAGVSDLWAMLAMTVDAFVTLVANLGGYIEALFGGQAAQSNAPVRFMSPVSQADFSQRAISSGPILALRWLAILSAAIGGLNLLPFPPLDGSHAVVAAVEGAVQRVRRNRQVVVDIRRLVPVAWFTLGCLVLLSVSALVMDLRDLAAS